MMPLLANAMTVLALAATSLSPVTTAPEVATGAAPLNDKIVVGLVTANGSGCPAKTTSVSVSPDSATFTVAFSDFVAQAGLGAKASDARKNCQLVVDVHLPAGLTYAPQAANTSGYVSVATGATVTFAQRYYFQGQSPTAARSNTFAGPLEGEWSSPAGFYGVTPLFAPCGDQRYLNINLELRVNAGASDPSAVASIVTMDQFSGLRFLLRRCP